MYLVKLPSLERIKSYIELLGAELAIATSISSNPSLYFSDIVLGVFNRRDLTNSFYNSFTSRLSQEKPDFYPNDDLILASYTLLSDRTDDKLYKSLMSRMLGNSNIRIIFDYYAIQCKEEDGAITLRRRKTNKFYKLRTKLHVPSGDFADRLA